MTFTKGDLPCAKKNSGNSNERTVKAAPTNVWCSDRKVWMWKKKDDDCKRKLAPC